MLTERRAASQCRLTGDVVDRSPAWVDGTSHMEQASHAWTLRQGPFLYIGLALILLAAGGVFLTGCSVFKRPARPGVATPVGRGRHFSGPGSGPLRPRRCRAMPAQRPVAPRRPGPAAAGEQPAEAPRPAATPSDRISVLLLGIDCRPEEAVCRSDAMMVLTFNTQTGAAGMLSLSRDSLVPIPGSPQEDEAITTDPPANLQAVGLLKPYRGQQAKLNTANFFGDLNHYPGRWA